MRAERDGGLEELDKGFRYLGAELDLALFEMEMHDVAARVGAATWDDETLMQWFDAIGRRCDAIAAEKGGARWGAKLLVSVALEDVEAKRKQRGR
jgi:hypothetical protein